MGGTLWRELGLAVVGRACSVNLYSNFLQMLGLCSLPDYLLGLMWPSPGVCSLYGKATGSMVRVKATSSKRTYANTLCLPRLLLSVPQPHSRPLSTHSFAVDPHTLISKSGSISCGVTAPFLWVLVHTRFCLCSLRVSVSPSPVEVL